MGRIGDDNVVPLVSNNSLTFAADLNPGRMQLLFPQHWHEYELIDSGNFEKLERFGRYTLIRPEPQAIWKKGLPEEEWRKHASARFVRDSSKAKKSTREDEGWTYFQKLEYGWPLKYAYKEMRLTLLLHFTSFGHVGVFPEQAENWDFIYDTVQSWPAPGKVLNLFAYTGGSSLAARAAGAEVTHVDAVKNMITWSNENQQASGLADIRWVVEDALKFVRREVKRGKQYNGIILDPPAYGRGPDGEKWVIEEGLNELMELCSRLLAPKDAFLVLNMYSMGLSALVAANLVESFFGEQHAQFGEFYLPSSTGQKLPLGTFLRFTR